MTLGTRTDEECIELANRQRKGEDLGFTDQFVNSWATVPAKGSAAPKKAAPKKPEPAKPEPKKAAPKKADAAPAKEAAPKKEAAKAAPKK
jgi:hypothetical protein